MTTKTPSTDLDTGISDLQALASEVGDNADWARREPEGSAKRDKFAAEALAGLEDMENVIRNVRREIEALP